MSQNISIVWKNCTDSHIIANRDVLMELYERFSFQVQGYRFMPAYLSGRWDGWLRLVSFDGVVKVGLIPDVIKFLKESGRNVKLSPEFKTFKIDIPFDINKLCLPFIPWKHQTDAIKIALEKKRQVILSPTSSGKSLVIYSIARATSSEKLKTLIIVPSIMLVTQLYGDFSDYSVNDVDWKVDDKIHCITGGVCKETEKSITISTWQSIQYIKDFKWFKQWDVILVDECHGCKAKVLSTIMGNCTNAFYRIGLSGTLDGLQSTEMELTGIFGPVRRIVTTKELMNSGQVSNVIIKAVILKHPLNVCKSVSSKEIPYKDEIMVIVKSQQRNTFICNLVKMTKGNTLVLVTAVKLHGEPLYKNIKNMCPDRLVYFIHGKVDADIREDVRRLTEENDGVIIIASYAIFSTGVSIKRLHNVIFGSPTKSSIRVLQSIGRILRLHDTKEVANVFDIVDDFRVNGEGSQNYALKHFMKRFEIYHKENFNFSIHEKKLTL